MLNIKIGFATNSSSYHSTVVMYEELYNLVFGKEIWFTYKGIKLNKAIYVSLGRMPETQEESDLTWKDIEKYRNGDTDQKLINEWVSENGNGVFRESEYYEEDKHSFIDKNGEKIIILCSYGRGG